MDSRIATREHIQTVQRVMQSAIANLEERSRVHDQSKLVTPEVEVFDEFTPKLAASTYGSDEYKGFLTEMKVGLDHHYAANSHHPEHYRWYCPCCSGSFSDASAPVSEVGNDTKRWCPKCCAHGGVIWEAELMDRPDKGILGMSLLGIIEMLCDWKAATLRHNDGDIRKSIDINQKRFGYSDEIKAILVNTVNEMGL